MPALHIAGRENKNILICSTATIRQIAQRSSKNEMAMANMINAHFVIISMPVSMSKLSIRSQIVCEVKGLDYDKHIVIVFVYLPDLLR